MEATTLKCPNCGAGLGALQGAEYVCAYCGHHSLPPEAPVDQARQDELVARAVAAQEQARLARFASEREGAEKQMARDRAAAERRATRGEALANVGWRFLVVVSLLWLLLILGLAVSGALPPDDVPGLYTSGLFHKEDDPATRVVLLLVGYATMFPLSLPLWIALFRWRKERRDRRFTLRGRALVLSCLAPDLERAGEAVLRVELPGRPAFQIKLTRELNLGGSGYDYVCRHGLAAGLELPVLGDASRPGHAKVDWETAAKMK